MGPPSTAVKAVAFHSRLKRRLVAGALLPLSFALMPTPASGEFWPRSLNLIGKNPSNWTVQTGGATGQLQFDPATDRFIFAARRLDAGVAYALVRYAGRPPEVEIVARGLADGEGKLRLAGKWSEWSRKFWLVLDADVVGTAGDGELDTFKGWHPEAYLFEVEQL